MQMVEIRALACRQLISHLKSELEGDELLMKEVWERCETDDHVEAVKWELEQEILPFLRERVQLLTGDEPRRTDRCSELES